jgi:dipeptidyl aminopeptidase/acylaminoacyl peptidase
MSQPATAPYGAWRSPITPDLIVAGAVRLGQVRVDGDAIYWTEGRPTEGGRMVVVRRGPDGSTADVTPPGFNARTRVHEYGGGSYLVHHGVVFFTNDSDQRLYRQEPGAEPRPMTPALGFRYADMVFDERRDRLICVCELHDASGHEPKNFLAAVPAQGGKPVPLVEGRDFYAAPRVSPDGATLAWMAWDHPNMPWDAAELWVAPISADGALGEARMLAGGPGDSVCQPEWSPDGALYFVAERSGWWNLYRAASELSGEAEALCPMEAEFGEPHWIFGDSTYAFDGPERIVCYYRRGGTAHLATLDTRSGALAELPSPFTEVGYLRVADGAALFTGAAPEWPAAVVRLDLASGRVEELRRSREVAVASGYISAPRQVEFPTEGGRTAFGFFYAPKNQDYVAPPGELPPLLVMSHGGPTGATAATLDLEVQYWTSRGVAVLDVNYGGSTGYGRAYRERLDGQWGVVDVDDCCNGARWLAAQGLVDGERMAITGGSAGGYTTLAALTFRDVFKAGASYYGIGDLEAMTRDTHKFESRYLDRLIGPYPERRDRYLERSPIQHVSALECPVIFFQGLEDKIVPPNQAEAMVAALRSKGLPVAYLAYEGEQHGFRKAENIVRSLESELFFYQRHLLWPDQPLPEGVTEISFE